MFNSLLDNFLLNFHRIVLSGLYAECTCNILILGKLQWGAVVIDFIIVHFQLSVSLAFAHASRHLLKQINSNWTHMHSFVKRIVKLMQFVNYILPSGELFLFVLWKTKPTLFALKIVGWNSAKLNKNLGLEIYKKIPTSKISSM